MRALVIAAVVAMLAPGCASPVGRPAGSSPVEPRSVATFDGASGARADWNALVSACREADIVVIGENHGHPVGLPFAATLWEDLLKDSPGAALSLEFFERDEQSRLDEYLSGVVDEPTFRKRTARTNGNYPSAHRDMVEAARAAKRPVIAANAPRPIVRLARTDGYDRLRELTPEQRRMFAIPESLPEGRYRDDFFKLMARPEQSHEKPKRGQPAKTPEALQAAADKRAESMFRSQSLWDWTMAESVVRAHEGGNRPVVHVVGRVHSDHDGGLIQAIRRMAPDARIVVVSVVDSTSTELREADRGRGTFVAYVGPGPRAD
jgi:uncharacterized iron-regulated protein